MMSVRSGQIALVGRQRELTALTALLTAASGGEGSIALVAGEPGIGKTRLLTELSERARAEGWTVLTGRSYDTEGMPPYLSFIEMLRASVRLASAERLRSQLGRGAAEVALLLPELHDLLLDLPARAPVSAAQERYRLFEAVCDVFDTVARDGETGLLLMLDDLQWADAPSLWLLQHLIRRVARMPGLIVMAYRTTELAPSAAFLDTLAMLAREGIPAPLILAPLSIEETATLAGAVAGEVVDPSITVAIQQTTEGNPFFIGEVVRSLQAEGRDLSAPDAAGIAFALPDQVRQVVSARLRRLRSTTNELLRHGAVLGDGFTFEVVRTAGGITADVAVGAIEESLAAGILRAEGAAYHFAHALIRRTIYDSLSLPRRQRLHLQAARAIEAVYARHLTPHTPALAAHHRLAGSEADVEKVIEYALLAGEAARAVSAFQEAVTHWQAALEAMEAQGVAPEHRAGALVRLGGALTIADLDRSTGFAYLEQALTLYEQAGARDHAADVRVQLGEILNSSPLSRDVARSAAYYQAAEAVLRHRPESVSLGYVYCGLAGAVHHRLYADEQLAASERALTIGERLGDAFLVSDASRHKSYALAGLGRNAESRLIGERAWQIADHAEAVMPAFWSAIAQGIIAMRLLGDPVDGADWHERELARPRLRQAPHPRRILLSSLADAWAERGDLQKAQRLHTDAEGLNLKIPGQIAAWAGDWDVATQGFDAGQRQFQQSGDRWNEWWLIYLYAAACRRWGERGRAQALLEDALIWVLEARHVATELATRAELALLLAQAGEVAGASIHLTRCREILAAGEDWRGRRGRVVLAEAVTLAVQGYPRDAGLLFAEAAGIFHRYELVWDEAESLLAWGRAQRSTGDRHRAAERAGDAVALLRRHGAGAPMIERLCRDGSPAHASRERAPLPDGLTLREGEVLGLLTGGLSNREIAAALVVSVRTVGRHVDNIYGKIGVHSRSQARRYAREHGIAAPEPGAH